MEDFHQEAEDRLRRLFQDAKYKAQLVLLSNTCDMFWDSSRHEPTTQALLDKLERRESLDALAALIAIVVEAHHLGRRSLAVKAASSLHKVLLMLAMELRWRGIAVGLIDGSTRLFRDYYRGDRGKSV
ncbi:hypothetical protein [Pseudomonas wadenswilerensis]|uniref:hypothetical protein n=1 Tax=Pseudomonas wadenswilerensis TaxID=1785161 RepID=UPI0039EF3AD5